MDFGFTEEQRIMVKSARDFLAREFPLDVVRQLEESDSGYSPLLWRKMADMGWMGLAVPEEFGGSGGSFLDLVVLLEVMGAHLTPGPFFASVVLGGGTILKGGSREQKEAYLPGLVRGERIFTLAFHEPGGGYDLSSIQTSVSLQGTGYVLSGTKLFVPDGHVADSILCVGRMKGSEGPEEGIVMFVVDAKSPGVTRTPLKTLARDKQCEVLFEQVEVPGKNLLREPAGGRRILQEVLEQAALARSAEMLGGAQAVLNMALTYARDRVQFERPIGSFQAVQHYCADMWIDITGSRNLLYKAAWKISQGKSAGKEAAMAKARVGEMYRKVTTLGHQIFGGIGYTMEHAMHSYHRRSIAGDLSFGDGDFQREKVARELGL